MSFLLSLVFLNICALNIMDFTWETLDKLQKSFLNVMCFYNKMMITPITPEIIVKVKTENEKNLLLIQMYSAMKEQSKKL